MHERSTDGRALPQSLESERAILGGLMLDATQLSTVSDLVSSADFYRPAHGRLFKLMLDMDARGEPIELVSVIERAISLKLDEEMGGLSYLTSLSGETPATTNLPYYAEQIASAARRRRLIASLQDALALAHDTSEELPDTLGKIEGKLLAVSHTPSSKGWVPIVQPVGDLYAHMVEQERSPGAVAGQPTGYHALDGLLNGLRPGQLIVLAARPGAGKTAIALNIAETFADAGVAVGFFSLEMPRRELAMRLIAGRATVRLGHLLNATLTREEWTRVRLAGRQLGLHVAWKRDEKTGRDYLDLTRENGYPLFIDDTTGLTIEQVSSTAKRLKADQPDLGLIVVDYIGLLRGDRLLSREQQVSMSSRGLKQLSKDLDLPVLALSQLNRKCEERPNKRPIPSDLRDSGSVEQDADVIMFVYRDEKYNLNSQEKGVAEIIIPKQRNGPTGTIKLLFEDCYCRFENTSF